MNKQLLKESSSEELKKINTTGYYKFRMTEKMKILSKEFFKDISNTDSDELIVELIIEYKNDLIDIVRTYSRIDYDNA